MLNIPCSSSGGCNCMVTSQPLASPAQSRPASREPAQLDYLPPAESQAGSIASSQPRASPARSSPASGEPALLDRVQPAESQPSSGVR
ncbi:hypothetical protein K440DRAFT_246141 [Wilcoxina mikolae CBS 423.85]|nr:hypothetical protein K440DRAFT_246141 [Wilcoxina mikolae CBS 423.85]